MERSRDPGEGPGREGEDSSPDAGAGGAEAKFVTAADLLAGGTLPVRMDVRVELTRQVPQPGGPPLSGSLLDRLAAEQERIWRWLAEDEGHRVLLVTDPLAALREVGVELSEDDWAALEAAHRQAEHADVLPPGVEVGSFDVTLAKRRREPPPEDDRAGSGEPGEER